MGASTSDMFGPRSQEARTVCQDAESRVSVLRQQLEEKMLALEREQQVSYMYSTDAVFMWGTNFYD